MSLSLEALILAGGNSRRMGQDKALLPHPSPEQPALLTYLCQVAQVHCARVSVLSPRPDQYQFLLPPGCRGLQESRPLDAPPPGPFIAFQQGLAQVEADWVLLLACDLPGLTAQAIQDWLPPLEAVTLDSTKSATIALLPQGPKGWEPLCGFYRRQALASLKQAIARGQESFQGWLATETVEPLLIPQPEALRNCNTREEWLWFQQNHERHAPRGHSN